MSFDHVIATACAWTITLLYIYLYIWGLDLRLNNVNYSYWYFSSSIIIIFLYWTSETPLSSSITTSEYLICNKADYLWGFLLILFNLTRQFYLSLVQVLFLQTMILIGKMLLLLILLLIWYLIDPLFLLAHSQNPIRAIILINSWLIYSVDSQIHLMLIKSLVLILIQEELKPASLIPLAALSLTSSIIFYFNITSTSTLILCNLTQTLQKSTFQ